MSSPYAQQAHEPETLSHAVRRMRGQGYTAKQIAGQIRRWHPDWKTTRVTAARIAASEPTLEKANPNFGKTSTKPFYPGQKPDSYINAGRGGSIPVYRYGRGSSGPALQTVLGAPAKGKTEEQTQKALGSVYAQNHPVGQRVIQGIAEGVPGVVVAKAVRDNRFGVNTLAHEAFNDVSSGLLPAGKAAGVLAGFRGLMKVREAEKGAEAAGVVAKLPSAAEVATARTEAARLRQLHSQISAKHEEILARPNQRPRTIAEAQARLRMLEAQHGNALDEIAAQMFGPIDKREVAFRNAENARARRQATGRTRNGNASGAAGRKSVLRPTVKEERRAEAERRIEQTIARNPNHPIAQAWRARTSEIDQLRKALNPDIFEKVDTAKLGYEPSTGKKLSAAADVANQRRVARLRQIESKIAAHEAVIERSAAMTAREKIQSGLPVAKITRGKQEAGYSPERAARAAKAEQAMQGIGGIAGHAAAKAALRGELPKVKFSGFGELTPENLEHAFRTVQTHPHLMPYQKIRVNDALQAAVDEGKVPTRSDLNLIEHVFGKDLSGTLKDSAKLSAWSKAIEVLNVPRSLMASFDVSAPFRQGLVIGARHPKMFFKNFVPMFRSLGSEKAYRGVMQDIVSRPSFPMMQEAKLALTDFEHGLAGQEEQFIGKNYAEKIPIAGRGVRGSGRAYTAFLNKTRADTFDHLIRVAQSQGRDVQNEEFLRSLGRYINAATGRGTYGSKALEQALPAMNAVLFSPRLLASRFNFLNPAWYVKQDPFVRKQALRAALQTLGAGSTVAGLAALGGAKVGMDPRNADFGKIRIGNTRADIWGGFQQPVRLVAQLASGKIVSSTTGKTLRLGPEGPGHLSRKDIAERFLIGKFAPAPSLLTDWASGGNLTGQKFDLKSEIAQRMIPLLIQDARDLYKERHGGMNGIEAALAGYGVGAFGVGIQTYGPKKPKAKSRGGSSSGSVYSQTGATGGSVYAGGGSSGGSVYAGR